MLLYSTFEFNKSKTILDSEGQQRDLLWIGNIMMGGLLISLFLFCISVGSASVIGITPEFDDSHIAVLNQETIKRGFFL